MSLHYATHARGSFHVFRSEISVSDPHCTVGRDRYGLRIDRSHNCPCCAKARRDPNRLDSGRTPAQLLSFASSPERGPGLLYVILPHHPSGLDCGGGHWRPRHTYSPASRIAAPHDRRRPRPAYAWGVHYGAVDFVEAVPRFPHDEHLHSNTRHTRC